MLVAIKGYKGHGKSTAAYALMDRNWVSLSFATPLKESLKLIFGLTDHELEDAVVKEQRLERWPHLSPREMMQHVGTDLFRHWIPDTWTRAFERTYLDYSVSGIDVVCPDLRFPNEADTIRNLGGYIIEIRDPRKDHGHDTHYAENIGASIKPDAFILNDGTIDKLRAGVAAQIEAWERQL